MASETLSRTTQKIGKRLRYDDHGTENGRSRNYNDSDYKINVSSEKKIFLGFDEVEPEEPLRAFKEQLSAQNPNSIEESLNEYDEDSDGEHPDSSNLPTS